MGVNLDTVISFTFGLGSALAGAAGILWAISNPSIDPLMGVLPGIKAFVAAVLGGIGNIPWCSRRWVAHRSGRDVCGRFVVFPVTATPSRFRCSSSSCCSGQPGLLGKVQVEKGLTPHPRDIVI